MKEAILKRNNEIIRIHETIRGTSKKNKDSRTTSLEEVNDSFIKTYYLLRSRYSFAISGYSNTCEETILKTYFSEMNLDVSLIGNNLDYSFLESENNEFDKDFYSSDELNGSQLFPYLGTPLIPATDSTANADTWDSINTNRLKKKELIFFFSFHSAKIIHHTFSKVFSKYMAEDSVWIKVINSDQSPIKLLNQYISEYKHPFVPLGSQSIVGVPAQISLLLEQDVSVDFTGIAAVDRVGIFYDNMDLYERMRSMEDCSEFFQNMRACTMKFDNDKKHAYDSEADEVDLCDLNRFNVDQSEFLSNLNDFHKSLCLDYDNVKTANRFKDLLVDNSETIITCFDSPTMNSLSMELFNGSELSCFASSNDENISTSVFSMKDCATILSKLLGEEQKTKLKVSEFISLLLALLLDTKNRANDKLIATGKINSFFTSVTNKLVKEIEAQHESSVTFDYESKRESIDNAITKVVVAAYFNEETDQDSAVLKLLRSSLTSIVESYPAKYKSYVITSWSSRIIKKDASRNNWSKQFESKYNSLTNANDTIETNEKLPKRKRYNRTSKNKKRKSSSVAKDQVKIDEEEEDDDDEEFLTEYVSKHVGHDENNLILIVKLKNHNKLENIPWFDAKTEIKTNGHVLFYINSNNYLFKRIPHIEIIEVVSHRIKIVDNVRKLFLNCKWSDKPDEIDNDNNFTDDPYVNYSSECRKYIIDNPALKKEFMSYLNDDEDDDIHRVIVSEGMFSKSSLTLKVLYLKSSEEQTIRINNSPDLINNKFLKNPYVQDYCLQNHSKSKPLCDAIEEIRNSCQRADENPSLLEIDTKPKDKRDQLQIEFSNRLKTIINLTAPTNSSNNRSDIVEKVYEMTQQLNIDSRQMIYDTIYNTEDNDSDGDKMAVINSKYDVEEEGERTYDHERKQQELDSILQHFDNLPSLKVDLVSSFQTSFMQTDSPWHNEKTSIALRNCLFNNIINELSKFKEMYCPNNSGENLIVQNSQSKSPGRLYPTNGFSLNEVIAIFDNNITIPFNLRLLESFINAINCNELQFYSNRDDENKVRTVVLNIQPVQVYNI